MLQNYWKTFVCASELMWRVVEHNSGLYNPSRAREAADFSNLTRFGSTMEVPTVMLGSNLEKLKIRETSLSFPVNYAAK